MKKNTIFKVVLLVIVLWVIFRTGGRKELLTTEQDSVIKYIDSKDDISAVAFIVAEMSKSASSDDKMFEKVLKLATENKKDEIKALITKN